jgi:transposase
MDDYYRSPSSTFQTQKFSLNSFERVISRKGLHRRPATSIISSEILRRLSGRKCNNLDLSALSESFNNYRRAVNLILERVYSGTAYAHMIGQELEDSRGMLYLVLRKEQRLKWSEENEFGQLVYERLHRNALETAARIVYGDYARRRLVNSLLDILASDTKQLLRLMISKRIPTDLIRRVRDTIEKKSIGSYHYALSACRQVRSVLRAKVREANPYEKGNRKSARELLDEKSSERMRTQTVLIEQVKEWRREGFPFITPTFQKNTMDFAASTENATGQGYWFQQDPNREDEIILYIKTPPGIIGNESFLESPYRSQTVRLRFLNWFPRKAERVRRKAQEARALGHVQRAIQLDYRAARFEDMSSQLQNTIRLQRLTRELAQERAKPEKNEIRIQDLKRILLELKRSRRSAPPLIRVEEKRVTLNIPFMSPDEDLLRAALPMPSERSRRAGVDRGLRHSMVVSIENGDDTYEERLIGRQELYEKREALRQQTRVLMSHVARKRNNWEKKHAGQQPPAIVLKKEQELESVWQKVRRLDREISHQVAAETVWFCEYHGVKTIYFEDLRSFQGKAGMRGHSWNLSTNLWGLMIEGVRYRREAMGHRNGSVWLVNPAWTSQICHVCGGQGIRVEDERSTIEKKGGEYFHCPRCDEHFHADINAARNIMYVQQPEPSAVPGRIT